MLERSDLPEQKDADPAASVYIPPAIPGVTSTSESLQTTSQSLPVEPVEKAEDAHSTAVVPASDNNSLREADHNPGAFAQAWNAITEAAQSFMNLCLEGLTAVGKFLGKILSKIALFGGGGLALFCKYVLKPVLMTILNVGAYFLDKIAFGSPALRQFLHDGLWSSDPTQAWRDFTAQNSGWDIYGTMHPVLDNIFGALGLCVGFINILNHTLASYGHLVHNYCHVLGTWGSFGERHPNEDKRNMPVQVIFGTLSLPITIPTLLLTNAFDAIWTVLKNLAISWFNNWRPYSHMLGKHGAFGKRHTFEDPETHEKKHWKDDRSKLAIGAYGALTGIPVAASILFTNVVDGILAFFKHTFLSYGRLTRSGFNIVLGDHGVMGPRTPYEDSRHWAAQGIFGFFSLPLTAPTVLITNIVDLLATFVTKFGHFLVHYLRPFAADFAQNFGQSVVRNIRANYHRLLGENGIWGAQEAYNDDRPLAARIFYGALSALVVGPAIAATNIADVFCTIVKNTAISWFNNQRPVWHLLGEWGKFGKRTFRDENGVERHWQDDRSKLAIAGYFLPALPFVIASAAVTNVLDVVVTTLVETCKSWFNNQRPIWHLLGEWGSFGKRTFKDENGEDRHWKDDRHWFKIGLFGLLSSPAVLATATVTNLLDCVVTVCKHFGLSFGRNFRSIFNLLGKHGIMGERYTYKDENGVDRHWKDERGWPAIIAYGLLSGIPVLVAAAITNLIDLIGAYFKNYKNTIVKPALFGVGVVVGGVTAPVAFVARKVGKGFYNAAIRPFKDEPFSASRTLKGVANVFTLGGFSAGKKLFKAVTGYTDRFGFPSNEKNHPAPGTNYFQEVQNKFKEAINLAAHGEFPDVKDGKSHFRMFMRIAYHMRHTVEKVVKALHDAYLDYAKTLQAEKTAASDVRYNMHSFFHSSQFTAAENKLRPELKGKESDLLDKVEGYLLPAASRM